MDKESQILVLRDNAKAELLQIATIEQGLTYLNKVRALETWVVAEKKDAELALILAEQRVRAGRVVGTLMKEAQESGELLKSGQNKEHRDRKNVAATNGCSHKKTLSDLGIDRSEASRFKRLAATPAEKFEAFIQEKKDAGQRPSIMAAVRLADEVCEKTDEISRVEYQRKVAAKTAIDDRIAELLKEINRWPKLYRAKIKAGIKE